MPDLTPEQIKKQELYRDARFTDQYDDIWQSVGKCVFCDLNEKYVFFEENGVVMTISLYAYIDGHFMIVPRRHIKSTKELTDLEWATIRKFTYIAKKLFKSVHGVRGMQLVQKDGETAQSTVGHIHFHCIPFDRPDLVTWNFRKLKYTPLQNVALYKNARKKIIAADLQFQKKYTNSQSVRVVCDLIIRNTNNQILFQERIKEAKLSPDVITLPGGSVANFNTSLEDELIREVKEETGYMVDTANLQLISSRVDRVVYSNQEKHLGTQYPLQNNIVRNTYVLHNFDETQELIAGDDAKELLWVAQDDIANHPSISDSTKEIIAGAQFND